MSASLKQEPIRSMISTTWENIIHDKREVLFLDKYHGQPGEWLIDTDYNARYKAYYGHGNGCMEKC